MANYGIIYPLQPFLDEIKQTGFTNYRGITFKPTENGMKVDAFKFTNKFPEGNYSPITTILPIGYMIEENTTQALTKYLMPTEFHVEQEKHNLEFWNRADIICPGDVYFEKSRLEFIKANFDYVLLSGAVVTYGTGSIALHKPYATMKLEGVGERGVPLTASKYLTGLLGAPCPPYWEKD